MIFNFKTYEISGTENDRKICTYQLLFTYYYRDHARTLQKNVFKTILNFP